MKQIFCLALLLLLACNKTGAIEKPEDLKQERLASEWGFEPQEDVLLTPLAAAAASTDLKEVKRLLDLGAEPNYRDKMFLTALSATLLTMDESSTAKEKQSQVIKLLLEHGADPNQRTRNNESSPLAIAVEGGGGEFKLAIVRLLLEHGADPNLPNSDNGLTPASDGGYPLDTAVGGGAQPANLEITKLLLEYGADPNLPRSDNGKTPSSSGARPLIIAVGGGPQPANLEITKLLLEHGADPNLGRSNNGKTPASNGARPLSFAVGGGPQPANLEITKLLLEHGADPNLPRSNNGLTPSSDGFTPIAWVAGGGTDLDVRILKLLLSAKPYKELPYFFGGNGIDIKGYTTLTGAIRFGRPEAVRLLLEAGINPNRKTEHGSPLEIAQKLDDVDKSKKMLALLKEFGAK